MIYDLPFNFRGFSCSIWLFKKKKKKPVYLYVAHLESEKDVGLQLKSDISKSPHFTANLLRSQGVWLLHNPAECH